MSIKKFISLLLSLFLIATFFSGCRKDSPPPTTAIVSMVKSQITTSTTGVPDTVIYAYDNTGRQVTAQTDTLVTTYIYAPNIVTMTYMLAGQTFQTTYHTNTAGVATSDSRSFAYTYSSWGYLTALSYTGTGTYDSTSYYISAGNVDTTIRHQVDSATDNSVTTIYTYLPTVDSRDYGLSFLGKQNTNLINTETITQVINGSTYTINYTYSYTFDYKGRVSQQMQSSGTATYTTAYTYY